MQDTSPRRTQSERTDRTRRALIDSGRVLFASKGFTGVGTTELADHAGVSRGAMYHQFRSKEALFGAVVESVEESVTTELVARLDPKLDTPAVLRAAARAWLDACRDPEVQQIVLLDGPVVLGWESFRQLIQKYGLGLTEGLLRTGVEEGSIKELPVDVMATMLLGAVNEAAMMIARSDDVDRTRHDALAVLDELLVALVV